ncbi:uncharacterized protein LOC141592925 [Silene latifolia]|uniref:uncharacterized protein LOC141592925 n=1 Tax=Silene latifolia TaxID=37657 RepID=UPI003D779880
MGNNTKHALTLSLLFIVITSISLPSNNAQVEIHFPSHLLPSTTQPPSHAPAPSPHHHHHHRHHRHASAPASAPSFAPTSPPQHSKPVTASPPAKAPIAHSPLVKPVHSPVHPPSAGPVHVGKRKFVAVQGLVYCKMNCSFSGVNTLLGASPLAGARVVLRCRNTQYLLRKTATTDTNGYFFLQAPPLLTTYGAHKCKVYLAHHHMNNTSAAGAGNGPCTNATNMNNGAIGAYLYSNNTGPPSPLPTFSLFSVGPFAYESTKCGKQ